VIRLPHKDLQTDELIRYSERFVVAVAVVEKGAVEGDGVVSKDEEKVKMVSRGVGRCGGLCIGNEKVEERMCNVLRKGTRLNYGFGGY